MIQLFVFQHDIMGDDVCCGMLSITDAKVEGEDSVLYLSNHFRPFPFILTVLSRMVQAGLWCCMVGYCHCSSV